MAISRVAWSNFQSDPLRGTLGLGLFLLAAISGAHVAEASPIHLRTNAIENPLGIDTSHPTFSWRSDAKTSNWMQSAYEILVATDAKNLLAAHADAWDSGRINSSESVNISYAGAALTSQQRYVWKVITWDNNGAQISFSARMV